jgi:hypothetical protein
MRGQTKKFNELAKDLKRFKELKTKLNPNNDPFMIVDFDDPDYREFNSLTIKLTPYFRAYPELLNFVKRQLTGFSIKEFKAEYRLICVNTWGSALEAWFECAGHLFDRGEPIPSEWCYQPKGLVTDPDCWWYEIFDTTITEDLREIGEFLFRYCRYLKHKGIDY